MKKITTLALVLVLIVSAFVFPVNAAWDGDASIQFGGEGTAERPYVIASVENLKWLQEEVLSGENYAGKYFVQTADIDLCDKEWMAIGTSTAPFSGVYNGQGYKITGLSITASAQFIGLFGYVVSTVNDQAGISNLSISGRIELMNLTADAGIGSLVGWVYKDADEGLKPVVISNITSNVDFLISNTAKQPRFGGILGYCFNAECNNLVYEGTIDYTGTATSRIGGIAGQSNRTTYNNCVNNGNITCTVTGASAGSNMGGMVGMITYKTATPTVFNNCVNNGDLKSVAEATNAYCGGITGGVYSSGSTYKIEMYNCLNTGAIHCEMTTAVEGKYAYAGGISAFAGKSDIFAEKCVNTGNVTSAGAIEDRAGGIVGSYNVENDDTVYIRDCMTSGALAGYITNAHDGCQENVATATLTSAADAITAALAPSDAKINGFPTEASAAVVTPETSAPTETTPAPVDETTPAPVDETTPAPVDETTPAPADETTKAPDNTPAQTTASSTGKTGGCGSAAMGIASIVVILGGCAIISKKKEN